MNRTAISPSGRRGSNPRPEPWQGSALPTALRPRTRAKSIAGEEYRQSE